MTRSDIRSLIEDKPTFLTLLNISIVLIAIIISLYSMLPLSQTIKLGLIIFIGGVIVFASVMLLWIYRAQRISNNRKLRRKLKLWKNL